MTDRRAIARAAPRAEADGPVEADAVMVELDHWLRTSALPVWWALGADHRGWGFHETLDFQGRPGTVERRARVQARQAYVFAPAGRLSWEGPWESAIAKALDALEAVFRRSDGLYLRLANASGTPLDDTALLYDQAFILLALSEAARVSPHRRQLIARAEALRASIDIYRWKAGGFREAGDRPFQANCYMHFFEACQAWLSVDGVDPAPWRHLAQEIADLAVTRFIDPESGVLREFFDADWKVADAASCGNVEPGHQFEWAWLMSEWRYIGGDVQPALIRGLYDAGRAGVDPRRGRSAPENRRQLDHGNLRGARRRLAALAAGGMVARRAHDVANGARQQLCFGRLDRGAGRQALSRNVGPRPVARFDDGERRLSRTAGPGQFALSFDLLPGLGSPKIAPAPELCLRRRTVCGLTGRHDLWRMRWDFPVNDPSSRSLSERWRACRTR